MIVVHHYNNKLLQFYIYMSNANIIQIYTHSISINLYNYPFFKFTLFYFMNKYMNILVYTTSIGNLFIKGKYHQVFNPLNKWNHTLIFPGLQYMIYQPFSHSKGTAYQSMLFDCQLPCTFSENVLASVS